MSKKEKLYRRLVNNQKNVKFSDFLLVVESFHFELDRIGGSHRVYQHVAVPQEFLVLQPDKNDQAKPYQIKQFLSLVEAYNLSMGNAAQEDNDE